MTPVVQRVYGISVRTLWPVPRVPVTDATMWDVEFVQGHANELRDAARLVPADQRDRDVQYAALPDGSRYCRWSSLFEFVVTADGRTIKVLAFDDTTLESLQAVLLVDALSIALVRLGWEPIHATAVACGEGAIALLGRSGYGKSTLGALFVRGGYPLIADDMLVLTPEGDRLLAHPGPPRLKLYRDTARRIFGSTVSGVPMNPVTDKLIIPLDGAQSAVGPLPLRALYVIAGQDEAGAQERPTVRALSAANALPMVLAACSMHWASEPDRLARQFAFVTSLVRNIPVKSLAYVRDENSMFAVRDAILDDLVEL